MSQCEERHGDISRLILNPRIQPRALYDYQGHGVGSQNEIQHRLFVENAITISADRFCGSISSFVFRMRARGMKQVVLLSFDFVGVPRMP